MQNCGIAARIRPQVLGNSSAMFRGFGKLQQSLVAMLVAISLVLSAFATSLVPAAFANSPSNCVASGNYSADFHSSKITHPLASKAKVAAVKADRSNGQPAGHSQLPASCCDSYCAPTIILSSANCGPVEVAEDAISAMKIDPLRSAAKNSLKRPPREQVSPILRA